MPKVPKHLFYRRYADGYLCQYKRITLSNVKDNSLKCTLSRGRSRAATTSKIECFVTIVNGFQLLIIITKHSILNVAAALDPPLLSLFERNQSFFLSIFQNQRLAKKFVITSICYLGYFFENYLKYFLEDYIFQGSKNTLKVNNRDTKRTCERICSKLIIKTPEQHQ